MKKITDIHQNILKCKVVFAKSVTSYLTYLVVEGDNKKGYLFRTLDPEDMLHDYPGRIYISWDKEGKQHYILLLDQSLDMEKIKTIAKNYTVGFSNSRHKDAEELKNNKILFNKYSLRELIPLI